METLKQEIINIGKRLSDKGLSPGISGNISLRYGKYFLVTPSGSALGELQPKDLVLMDASSRIIDGKAKPTSEAKLHLEIYKRRPDINAIIHCHSPKASSFAVSDVPLSLPVLAESIFHLGDIPVAKYHLPSTTAVAEETAQFFDKNDVVLMQNHGIVFGGKNLKEAYYRAETAEYIAEVIINAKILGNIKLLSTEEVQEVAKLREQMK